MKNNFSLENLRDIILLMMTQKNTRFGWDFLDSISKCIICWLDVIYSMDKR